MSPPDILVVPRRQGRAAGLATRTAAAAVDFVVVIAVVGFLYLAGTGVAFAVSPHRFHWPDWLSMTIPVVYVVVAVCYLFLSWRSTGQTIGDAVFGVRVYSRFGRPLGALQGLIRSALCVIVPIGLLWVPFSRTRSSLQDVLVRTEVCYDWAPRVPYSPVVAAADRLT